MGHTFRYRLCGDLSERVKTHTHHHKQAATVSWCDVSPLIPRTVTYPLSLSGFGVVHKDRRSDPEAKQSFLSEIPRILRTHSNRPRSLPISYISSSRWPNYWTMLFTCQHAHSLTPVVYISWNCNSILPLESFQVVFIHLRAFRSLHAHTSHSLAIFA